MTTAPIKIKLAQINFIVGDLEGNFQKIVQSFEESKNDTDLIVFSELSLSGYPPEDLLCKSYFLKECDEKIKKLTRITQNSNCAILVGAPNLVEKNNNQKLLFNSAFLLANGKIKAIANKAILPNYGVFDEKRYFATELELTCIEFKGFRLGILICEDIWEINNASSLKEKNPDIIITINASPFSVNKLKKRLKIVKKFTTDIKHPVIYVNQIGGQDSLVFDGGSFVTNSHGNTILNMAEFREDSASIEVIKNKDQVEVRAIKSNIKLSLELTEQLYQACILGVRDYVGKNGFDKVLIGLSGGIDSAIVAMIAVDALGNDKVKLVTLPSKYNSSEGIDDAFLMSNNLVRD